MKEKKHLNIRRILSILEIPVDIAVLALGIQILAAPQSTGEYSVALIFALFAFSCAVCAIVTGKRDKLPFIRYIVYASGYFLNSILLFLMKDSDIILVAAFYIYAALMIFGRVMSIIIRRRKVYTAINILAAVFWVLAALIVTASGEFGYFIVVIILGLTIPLQMLIRITQLSFAHIRYDILVKVIRKSMAAEILTGLLILIAAFSVGLYYIEPGIESYSDALWYCFAIITTIGFGDFTAVTVIGRIMSVILGIYGIIVVSLVTSVIVNFYTEVNKEPADRNDNTPAVPDEDHNE